MKKLNAVIICVVVFGASFLLTGLIMGSGNNVNAAVTQAPEGQARYTLKEHNGFIAVFCDDIYGEPMIETDISTAMLRTVDKEKLASGINADSYEQILSLLEDFGS